MMETTWDLDQAVARILELIRSRTGKDHPLAIYHRVGTVLQAVPPRQYAQDIWGELADKLEPHVKGFKASTLRKAAKFSKLDWADVERFQGINWRDASRLTSKYLSATKRRRIIDDLVRGGSYREELGEEIKKNSSPKARQTASAVSAAIKRAEDAGDEIQILLRDLKSSWYPEHRRDQLIRILRNLAAKINQSLGDDPQ